MHSMRKSNIDLCQTILKQTNSIDETARVISDYKQVSRGVFYWKRQIIKHIESGDLVI